MPYDVETIKEELLFSMPAVPTAAALLMGAKSVSGSIARETADLYKAGRFNKIILAGGAKVFEPQVRFSLMLASRFLEPVCLHEQDFLSLQTEAEYMRDILLEKDVPEEAIVFIDDQSKKTSENIDNTLSYLQDFSSVTILAVAYHQKRALATARYHEELDNVVFTTHPVYPFGFTRDNWPPVPMAQKHLSKEMDNLDPLNENTHIGHFCKDIDLDVEVKRAQSLVVSQPTGPIPVP